jgi:hypothetical protein
LTDVRFRKIDDSNRGDHYRLTADDSCLFLYEYTAHAGYAHSDTNNLISNLKKKPSESWKNGYSYKAKAIRRCAGDLANSLNEGWLDKVTIVPAPSSKAKGHPDYDDRLIQILQAIRPQKPLDIREILTVQNSRAAAHEGEQRPTVEELVASYTIDEQAIASKPITQIGIFDDVLTVGTTFRAMSETLGARFPGMRIDGIFIARRAIQNPFAEIDLSDLDF